MSKKIVIFGATGHTGKYIVRKFSKTENMEISVFVRNSDKFETMNLDRIRVIQGDAMNYSDVENATNNQEVILASLEGDVLSMAKNIVTAARKNGVKRIIWITGMGIHHEIKGLRGKMLGILAKSRPEYIEAADLIAVSGIDYTLLRCPGIRDGNNEEYYLTTEDVQPRKKSVDRAAIAKCMADMVIDEDLGKNQSLGITN